MKKRTFLKLSSLAAMASLIPPLQSQSHATKGIFLSEETLRYPFTLPSLPFASNALEPYIDQKTMEVHYGQHHQTYIQKLNDYLENNPRKGLTLTELMGSIETSDTILRNNGGGHYNHLLFWQLLSPPETFRKPEGSILEAIRSSFTSLEQWQEQFSQAAKSVFGSGWVWLIVSDTERKLKIVTSSGQDNPLMRKVVPETGKPILCLDVWEHAYYLKYQQARADYIQSFYRLINWQEVARRYQAAL